MIEGLTSRTALKTADVLSDPEDQPTAEKELLVNGGRLQPGCYEQSKDETSIKKRKKLHHKIFDQITFATSHFCLIISLYFRSGKSTQMFR